MTPKTALNLDVTKTLKNAEKLNKERKRKKKMKRKRKKENCIKKERIKKSNKKKVKRKKQTYVTFASKSLSKFTHFPLSKKEVKTRLKQRPLLVSI